MRRPLTLIVPLVFVALVAAGCGSSSGSDSSGSGGGGSGYGTKTTTPAGGSGKVAKLTKQAGLDGTVTVGKDAGDVEGSPTGSKMEVELADFYIGPAFITAKGGTTLHLTIKNAGSMEHTFNVDSQHISEEVGPGKEATVDVKVPTSGAVPFYCKYHKGGGMQGAIIVS